MKRFIHPLSIVVVALLFSACGGESGAARHSDHARADSAQAVVEDGIQIVEIHAGKMGFEPSEVTLQAGIPARLVFTRTVESSCAEHIKIPDYGIGKTELPLDEAVAIEITPDEAGSVKFICGMDMQTGTIVIRS